MAKEITYSDMTFPKHSSSIAISNNLTTIQKKVFNVLIYNARQTKPNSEGIYSISINQLKEHLGIPRYDKNNTHLKNRIEEIMKIVVKFDLLKKDVSVNWTAAPLLAGAQIRNGVLRYSFSQFLEEKLLDPEIFTILDLLIIQGLNSKYSIALYENVKDFSTSEFPKIPINLFRELMGVESDKYKSITDLKKRVIETSIQEINEKTDININYELIKQGRGFKYIKFNAKPSKNLNKEAYLEELNKKIDNLNKLFIGVQIMVNDKNRDIICTFQNVEYRQKKEKVVLNLKDVTGKTKLLEFNNFEDVKSTIQKNMIL
ncbi:MAG: replication initiation protein [Campylobacterales bacterium]|nr:replication initiation protein [Campylobacterales bacterium]